MLACSSTVYLPQGPPDPIAETPAARPAPDWIWIEGHWKWNGHDYAWVPGRWVEPREGSWEPGRWEDQDGRWFWLPGHWRD